MTISVNKIIYTNGMLTEPQGALEAAKKIHHISGIDTEVLHNGSTTYLTIGAIGKNVIGGLFALGECKLDKALYSLGKVFKIWLNVQKKKHTHAKELVGRVKAHLNENPNQKILLIFHSQGAHIGLKALKKLGDYKDRIEVLSMGGMVHIPKHLASKVTNLSNTDDPVPNWIAGFLSEKGEVIDLGRDHAETFFAHGADEYLKHDLTQQIISSATLS